MTKIAIITNAIIIFYTVLQSNNISSTINDIENCKIEYLNHIFKDCESTLNPKFLIVAEKDCNFKIFNKLLGNRKVGIFRKGKSRSFIFDDHLTEEYLKNKPLPKTSNYILLSPYINIDSFPSEQAFYFNFTVETDILGTTEKIYRNILTILKKSSMFEYKDELMTFKRVKNENFELIEFDLKGSGKYIETNYFKNDEIISKLTNLKLSTATYSTFLNDTTLKLLRILKEYDIFSNKLDIEEFPDVIPLIFPFQILSHIYKQSKAVQLVTLGFDLRHCLDDKLSFLFNKEQVNKLLSMGGVWYITKTCQIKAK